MTSQDDCVKEVTWDNDWLPHGPIMGYHMVVGKFPMTPRD
jgi:hypothetical protein